jgi:hypothetical protein
MISMNSASWECPGKAEGDFMSAKTLSVIFSASIAVLLIAEVAVAAQNLVSARVLAIEGQVEIQRNPGNQAQAQKISFKIDDELKAGDRIITGRKGRLALGLSDGSQAVIAPQTTVVIQDISQSPRELFNVIRGKTRIHIEKLGGQPNPYRVNTPTAVIAVRGTVFDILVDGDETQVYLHEGAVTVSNLTTPAQPVFLSAGQMTRIYLRNLPIAPTRFKTGRNNKLFKFGKVNQIESADRGNRRVAINGARPDFGNDGNPRGPVSGTNSKPDFGRGEPKPDFSRSGSSPSPAGSPSGGSGGSRPNANPKPNGKKS